MYGLKRKNIGLRTLRNWVFQTGKYSSGESTSFIKYSWKDCY